MANVEEISSTSSSVEKGLEAASVEDLVEISPAKVRGSSASASSTGQESLGGYDANRACRVKTVKGRIVEAKMTAGKDGFMYASYGSGQPQQTEVPVMLWKQSLEAKKKRASGEGAVQKKPGVKRPAAAPKGKAKAKAKSRKMLMKKPAGPEDPEVDEIPEPSQDSGDVVRYAPVYYGKKEKVGMCKFWKGRKKMLRRQLFDVRTSLNKDDSYAKGKDVAGQLFRQELREQDAKASLEALLNPK